jgi:hypothetical protein
MYTQGCDCEAVQEFLPSLRSISKSTHNFTSKLRIGRFRSSRFAKRTERIGYVCTIVTPVATGVLLNLLTSSRQIVRYTSRYNRYIEADHTEVALIQAL